MAQAGTVWVDVRGNTAPLALDIGKAAAAASAVALVGLGAAAVRESTQFNKAMSGVAAAADATSAELTALSDAALQAGADTAFTAREAAKAEAELTRAGISTADVLGGALAGSLDLAAAGQVDLAFAATTTAQALNTFNLQGEDASHVADVLAAGANKSAADVKSLGDALAQGGLVAKQTGLSLEDTVGVLSLFADNALVGSDAGTSLKTALQRLVPTSKEAAGTMEALGLSFFDQQGNFIGIAETAQALQDALGGLSTEQRQAALTTIFGADAIRAAGLLYEAGAEGVNEYTTAVNDQGAASRMAATQLDNLSGDLEKLRGSWETLLIGLGSSADSGLRDVVQALTEGVDSVGEFVQSPVFDEISERVAKVIGSIADGITEASDSFTDALDGLDAAGVDEFFTNLASAAEGLEGPILGVGAALASLAATKLPFVGGLIPGITPLQGAIAGIVLQSEEGRAALGSMFDIGVQAAEAAAPIMGALADILGTVADQGWLVKGALDAFVAYKIVSIVGPWVKTVGEFGAALATIPGQISAIAASKGISQLEALKGVMGASGLTGTVAGLTSAIAGPAGIVAAIAGGLYIYQSWADEQRKVESATKDLTAALLTQGDVAAGLEIASRFGTALSDAGIDDAFARAGIAISSVTSLLDENSAAVDRSLGELQDLFSGTEAQVKGTSTEVIRASDAYLNASPKVQSFVDQLLASRDASAITDAELVNLLGVIDEFAEITTGSGAALDAQAERFRAEAEAVRLSADAQRDLNTALDDNASLQDRRDALARLIEAYPHLAEKAGIAADEVGKTGDATERSGDQSQTAAGQYVDAAAGLELLGEGAESALDGMLGLIGAQDDLDDANQRVADAQQNLTDILTGNTDAVNNAREALADAQAALAKARSETGPGSKAAKDAARELRDAKQALRDAMIDAGREPEEGDFMEDKRQAVLDALDRVAEAEKKLADINAGISDQVVSAQERVADAQANLNKALQDTGPNSRAARDAQEELDDANLAVAQSAQDVDESLKELNSGAIPESIAQLEALRDAGLITQQQFDDLARAILNYRALLELPPPVPGTSTPTPSRPRVPNVNDQPLHGPPQRSGGFLDQPILGGGRAYGGDVWTGTMFPVGERGDPELLTSGGKQFLIPGEAGHVTPLAPLGGDGATIGLLVAAIGEVRDEQRHLRSELLMTVRDLARTLSPGAGEELAPLLRNIAVSNNRIANAPRWHNDPRSVRSAAAEFV